jgi:FkbM family methyltransferase
MKCIQLNHPSGSIPVHYRESTSDESVIQQIFVQHDYDLGRLQINTEISSYLSENISKGLRPFIIDLGANIGASALYFLLNYPGARVVAVEPDQRNVELLTENTKGYDCIVVQGAVASSKGFAKVCDPALGPWGLRTELDPQGSVETFTVPELMDLYGADPQFFPFLIKIDIEGAESELFSLNTEWVSAFPVLIIELHDWILPGTNNSRNFLKCVSALPRDFVYFGENVFSVRTPVVLPTELSPPGTGFSGVSEVFV